MSELVRRQQSPQHLVIVQHRAGQQPHLEGDDGGEAPDRVGDGGAAVHRQGVALGGPELCVALAWSVQCRRVRLATWWSWSQRTESGTVNTAATSPGLRTTVQSVQLRGAVGHLGCRERLEKSGTRPSTGVAL